ncbi:OmpP1/FadL family transporter [Thiomicrorhabdus sp. 6S3-12]|uniref:OmpP1/FadL family transporter n=1 Tax=Thiomicrorhabdus sp. 6S3-12 TaxID=2819681 RepID=UPI001AAD1EB5|nr:outer membrane protein transport protein [Thiomicrorhabdus sp. 6S3-12]MBO1923809.1 outer membrane protein transport protein [Thiomicrorhabdus sp. 6S3-12]
MRKTKLALAIAASTIISTPAFATNGDVLIGLGAQARALGGTGTAAFFGSENALTNPALLGKSQGSEFSIGGTIFMPDVTATSDVASPGTATSEQSDNDLNIIPEVSLSTRINENLTFGLGMFGSAGMGVDYRGTPELFDGYSNLQLMKFAPTLAYNEANFGIGFAPVVQYGALDINYTADGTVGNGMSTDLGYGYNLGGYFDITPEFTIALAYQSAIEMEYDGQISTAAEGLGIPAGMMGDELEQPAEIKVGAAYTMGDWLMTADYKQIKWSDAKGYQDFQWDDQNVFAVGAKYSGNGYWLGFGYNYAEDPIEVIGTDAPPVTSGMDGYYAQAIDMFNNHFFPGIVESHFTVGGGINLTKNSALDFAIVYADEVTKTVNTGVVSDGIATMQGAPGAPYGLAADASTHTTKHSQTGFTVAYRMNF